MQQGFGDLPFSSNEENLWRCRISISNIHIEPARAAYRTFEKGGDIAGL